MVVRQRLGESPGMRARPLAEQGVSSVASAYDIDLRRPLPPCCGLFIRAGRAGEFRSFRELAGLHTDHDGAFRVVAIQREAVHLAAVGG